MDVPQTLYTLYHTPTTEFLVMSKGFVYSSMSGHTLSPTIQCAL